MRIDNYKYNEQTFEKEAYQLLQKRDIADNNLKRQERLLKKDVRNISLDYYKAYLNYMHQSNEHMASFLAYLKHEYEMSRRTTILFFNDEEMLNALNNNIEKLKKSFKLLTLLFFDLSCNTTKISSETFFISLNKAFCVSNSSTTILSL